MPAAVPPVATEAPVPVRFAAEQSFSADSYGVDADEPDARASASGGPADRGHARCRAAAGIRGGLLRGRPWRIARASVGYGAAGDTRHRRSAGRGQPVGAPVFGSRGRTRSRRQRQRADAVGAHRRPCRRTTPVVGQAVRPRGAAGVACRRARSCRHVRPDRRALDADKAGVTRERPLARPDAADARRAAVRHYVVRVVQPGYRARREVEFALSRARTPARLDQRRGCRASPRPRRPPASTGATAAPPRRTRPADSPASLYVDSRPRGATVLVDGKSSARRRCGCPTFAIGSTSSGSSWRNIRPGRRPRGSPPDRRAASPGRSRRISMKATLALENGLWYEGEAAGAAGETGGEVVFNTSMTGYQEVLTDPSYAGQIVTMTAPEIGNYGVAPRGRRIARRRRWPASSSARSRRSPATGAPTARCATTSSRHGIVAISDIDTRALTRVLRSAGVMRGVIATGDVDPRALVERAQALPPMEGSDLVLGVTCERAFDWAPATPLAEDEFAPPPSATQAPQPARRRLRLRHEVEHPAPVHRLRLRRARVSGDGAGVGAARRRTRTACSSATARAIRRSLAYAIENAKHAGRRGRAGVRHLPRPPDPVAGDGRRDLQAEVRPSRRATIRSRSSTTGKVEITSQNHGFAVDPGVAADRRARSRT